MSKARICADCAWFNFYTGKHGYCRRVTWGLVAGKYQDIDLGLVFDDLPACPAFKDKDETPENRLTDDLDFLLHNLSFTISNKGSNIQKQSQGDKWQELKRAVDSKRDETKSVGFLAGLAWVRGRMECLEEKEPEPWACCCVCQEDIEKQSDARTCSICGLEFCEDCGSSSSTRANPVCFDCHNKMKFGR